jgi:hypothetical protein
LTFYPHIPLPQAGILFAPPLQRFDPCYSIETNQCPQQVSNLFDCGKEDTFFMKKSAGALSVIGRE